ncbi:MAG: hypothetical protein IJ533_03780 [Prevotella sp.]|nr:hypothetical protein [Prevotella sp.]
MKAQGSVALTILLLLTACYSGQRSRMLALLDEADSLNRAYAQLPSDTLLLEAADFFDRHGSRNEQVRAHYLLGCAYRDQGQAPRAVDCFLDAVAKADISAVDCDFHVLGCVYSQLGDQYHIQLLFEDEVQARKLSHHFAKLAGDTLGAISSINLLAAAYILKNELDSAETTIRTAMNLYEKHGYKQRSIQSSNILMHLLVNCPSRWAELKELIDRYDKECELFDDNRELPPYKRQYYYYKGKYFEHTNQLDSAEFYYRRIYYPEMRAIYQTPMFEGLLSVFQKKHQPDSIAKYAQLYCAATDSSIISKDKDITAQLTASYNYTFYQKEARTNEQKANAIMLWWLLTFLLGIVLLLVVSFSIMRYRRIQQEKHREIKRLHDIELNKQISLYNKKQEELHQLKTLADDYKEELDNQRKLHHIHQEVLSILQNELSVATVDNERYRTLYAQSRKDFEIVVSEYESKQREFDENNCKIIT